MKRLMFLVLLLTCALWPLASFGQQANDVAHGSEKVSHEIAHPNEAHGEGHEAPKTYFGIPGWILKLVNMLLFIGLLGYLVKGPVSAAFRARSEQIRAEMVEARERREKSEQLAADIQRRLSQVESEVESVLQRAREEGERQKREIIEAAKVESEKILTTARNEVDARVKLARKELTEYAGDLATSRAHALLESSMTDADRKRFFAESVKRVEESQS